MTNEVKGRIMLWLFISGLCCISFAAGEWRGISKEHSKTHTLYVGPTGNKVECINGGCKVSKVDISNFDKCGFIMPNGELEWKECPND